MSDENTTLDLDAIEAKWKGYDGPLYVAVNDDGETVITAADDGSPYVSRVAVMDDLDEHAAAVRAALR